VFAHAQPLSLGADALSPAARSLRTPSSASAVAQKPVTSIRPVRRCPGWCSGRSAPRLRPGVRRPASRRSTPAAPSC